MSGDTGLVGTKKRLILISVGYLPCSRRGVSIHDVSEMHFIEPSMANCLES